ncbi:MAG: hypothetical protein FWE86_01330 [Oscillospiraceae bacterium]|nr:hypothetical protein [Oscillospiraceae bacterium]
MITKEAKNVKGSLRRYAPYDISGFFCCGKCDDELIRAAEMEICYNSSK